MNTAIWIHTEIPTELVSSTLETLKSHDDDLFDSKTTGYSAGVRDSKQLWVPENVWICGWIKHYADMANRNFQYDLTGIHEHHIQYTVYGEGGKFDWHIDDSQPDKLEIRKLAFSLQLSDESEYQDGELEFLDNKQRFIAPKNQGTIIFFDPRVTHRVRKIKSGTRRALVGWIGGPRWK